MSVRAYPTRGRAEAILEPAAPEVDPEGLISRYLEFTLRRAEQGDKLPVTGSLTERLQAVHWYLTAYRGQTGLPVPLSEAQIAFLNGPVPLLGVGPEMSVAAYSFIVNERGSAGLSGTPAELREAVFWWCTACASAIAPAGELITAAQVRLLTQVEERDVHAELCLNHFVHRLRDSDPSLGHFDIGRVIGRASLLATLLVRTGEKPYLLKLLPHASVSELLAGAAGASLFDRILAASLGPAGVPDAAMAAEVRALLETRLRQHGLCLSDPARPAERGLAGTAPFVVHAPAIGSEQEAGIAVIGPSRIASGLGQATRLSIETLREAGRRPAVLDFDFYDPGRTGFSDASRAPDLRRPRQINLIHLNAEAVPFAFAYLDRRVFARSYNIGFFFWELDRVPAAHRLGLSLVDEIWVASEYNRETYARVAEVPVRNVGMAVQPLPDPARISRDDLGLPEDAFLFLATFDSFSFIERKNPLGLIAAFQAAFPAGGDARVRLVLKTQNRTRIGGVHHTRVWQTIDDIVARDPRIRIIDRTMRYEEILGLKRLCDAYVSLHRSEGLGFGLIEAMQLGRPVIATGYSGNMEFCSEETAYLVDYELMQAMPSEYVLVERGSRWAEPSIRSAAEALRTVVADRAGAQARAAAAARRAGDHFSVAAIAKRYEARLREIDAIIAGQSV